jgi:hypothetical protein
MALAKYFEEIAERLINDADRFEQEHKESEKYEMLELASYKQERVKLAIQQAVDQLLDLITDPKIEKELKKAEDHSKLLGYSNLEEALHSKDQLIKELTSMHEANEKRISDLTFKQANIHTYYKRRIEVIEEKIEEKEVTNKNAKSIHELMEDDIKELLPQNLKDGKKT